MDKYKCPKCGYDIDANDQQANVFSWDDGHDSIELVCDECNTLSVFDY